MINYNFYCSPELSLQLMKKGFEGICHSVYTENGKSFRNSLNSYTVKNITDKEILRPTIEEVRHWLNEEKHIGIYVFEVDINKFKGNITRKQGTQFFSNKLDITFNNEISAYEYLIKYVLDNYIKDKSAESAAESYMLSLYNKKAQENHEFDEGNNWHEGYLTSIKDCIKAAFLAGVDYHKKETDKQ